MSNLISIYGNSNNPRAVDIEKMYKEQKHECIEHFESFMRDLIIEDLRHKKNIRYIRSKKLINCGMALHITYIEVINLFLFILRILEPFWRNFVYKEK